MKNNSTRAGIGFFEAIAILFITLKLCKVIDWSWWWVLSPIWIPVAIMLILLAVYGCMLLKEKWDQRGTVACMECEYRGCIVSEGFGTTKVHCKKYGTVCPVNYRCKEGIRREPIRKRQDKSTSCSGTKSDG